MTTIVNSLFEDMPSNSLCPLIKDDDDLSVLKESMEELCSQIRVDLGALSEIEWNY